MHCVYIHFVGKYNGESEKMSVNSNIKLEQGLDGIVYSLPYRA